MNRRAAHRVAHMIGAAARGRRRVVGDYVGIELVHAHVFHRHLQLFRRDLRKNRVAALADFHCSREHGHFSLRVDGHAGVGSGR